MKVCKRNRDGEILCVSKPVKVIPADKLLTEKEINNVIYEITGRCNDDLAVAINNAYKKKAENGE